MKPMRLFLLSQLKTMMAPMPAQAENVGVKPHINNPMRTAMGIKKCQPSFRTDFMDGISWRSNGFKPNFLARKWTKKVTLKKYRIAGIKATPDYGEVRESGSTGS